MQDNVFINQEEIKGQFAIAARLKSALGPGKKAYISTFGCQQNEADSERLMGLCGLMGYGVAPSIEEADLIIFNTCAIREHAELKVLSKAGAIRKLKEKNRYLITALCGCMAEQPHRRDKLLTSYPYIDFIFGTDKQHLLPEMVENALNGKKQQVYISGKPHNDFGVIAEGLPVRRDSAYKAWVSIMYGCNNFCTYCVVPYVRGRERSRRSEDVLAEIKALVDAGYKDITLLGQNVNSYKGDYSFPELLKRASDFDGDYWLRFMTSHPKDASKELVDIMAGNPHIAPHFHLPMQSGDNRILGLMNRRYTREQYMEKAAYIKATVPGIALSSDIICGYPTETEEEFENTVDAVDKVGFDMLFTFVYSPRPGTPAAEMEQVDHKVKTERFARLSALENRRAEELNSRFLGKTVKVLADGKEGDIYKGRTGQNKIITFTSPKEVKVGEFVEVEVEKTSAYTMEGKKVES